MVKIHARSHCPFCNNDKYYFEFNPDWHKMKVYQRVCANCGARVTLYQHNDASIFIEQQEIEKELKPILNKE